MSAMAAVGRGSACAAGVQILLLVLLSLLTHQAHGVVHTVGGASGWDLGIDYASWAAGQTFAVGDVLFFPYQQTEHDVVVVSKAGYDACSAASPIDTYSAGNDNVTLTSAGAHYYMCSVIGHCAGGMKLAVTVTAAAAAPTPAPPPSPTPPSSSPSPSSRKTPSPSPIPSAPAPTPSSSPAPSPSLAPAPTSPAPSPTAPAPAPAIATPAPSISTPSTAPTPGSPPSPPSPPPPPSPPNAAVPLFSASLASLALALASLLLATTL